MRQRKEFKITATSKDDPDWLDLCVWERSVMGDAVTDWRRVAVGGASLMRFPGFSRSTLRAAIKSVFH